MCFDDLKVQLKMNFLVLRLRLGMLVAPTSSTVQKSELTELVRATEKDLKFLFGSQTPAASKLATLLVELETAEITRSSAFILARELYPAKKDMSPKVGFIRITFKTH